MKKHKRRKSVPIRAMEVYNNQPLMQLARVAGGSVAALAGGWPAVIADKALELVFKRFIRRNDKAFFEELEQGAYRLTPELINSEPFLYRFVSTYTASTRAEQEEKARLFARLLLNAVEPERIQDERFTEYLSILEDLSAREIRILAILQEVAATHPAELVSGPSGQTEWETDMQQASRYWPVFEARVQSECSLYPGELEPLLTRLARTGLYRLAIGYLNTIPGSGALTPMYADFVQWVQAKARETGEDAASHRESHEPEAGV
jgi:hypothetical protein